MTRQELQEQKTGLITYLQNKVKAGDWQAGQDAASDIREIDAKLEVLVEISDAQGQEFKASGISVMSGQGSIDIIQRRIG